MGTLPLLFIKQRSKVSHPIYPKLFSRKSDALVEGNLANAVQNCVSFTQLYTLRCTVRVVHAHCTYDFVNTVGLFPFFSSFGSLSQWQAGTFPEATPAGDRTLKTGTVPGDGDGVTQTFLLFYTFTIFPTFPPSVLLPTFLRFYSFFPFFLLFLLFHTFPTFVISTFLLFFLLLLLFPYFY